MSSTELCSSSSTSQSECEDDRPLLDDVPDGKGVKMRHMLALLGCLGFANVYAMRVNLSVAIVAMVNNSALPEVNISSSDLCPVTPTNVTTPESDGEFVWDEKTQGLILGSFFYGYVMTQIPGGRLAELFGGKMVYGLGVLITGILTFISPIAAKLGTGYFIAVRVLEGLSEGVTFPSMHVLLAHWIPPLDRPKYGSIVYTGATVGTVISMPIAGYLCTLTYFGGWPLSFYLFGGLSILWFMAWMFFVYDSPSTHPRISPEERQFILMQLEKIDDNPKFSTPWKSIFLSLPVWAMIVSQCCSSWSFYTQLTELPTYMKNILHFDVTQLSVLNALPALSCWICAILFSLLATWALHHNHMSILTSYKVFNALATVFPAIGSIVIAVDICDSDTIVAMLIISGGFAGAAFSGSQMNHISLSPKYAGTLYGITNSAGNICGFFAPYAIGLLINGQETLSQWQKVFYIAAGTNIIGLIFYTLFASATEQPWSAGHSDKQSQEPILEETLNEDNSSIQNKRLSV